MISLRIPRDPRNIVDIDHKGPMTFEQEGAVLQVLFNPFQGASEEYPFNLIVVGPVDLDVIVDGFDHQKVLEPDFNFLFSALGRKGKDLMIFFALGGLSLQGEDVVVHAPRRFGVFFYKEELDG